MTGLLVRSTATDWAKGSVLAVDAGTHLAAVTNIIHQHLPNAVPRRSSPPSLSRPPSVFSPANESFQDGEDKPSNHTPGQATAPSEIIKPQLFLSTGPLANLGLPYATAKANAAYFVRNLITTYLITHPHLDHISGFVINTAGFQHTSRPKRLAGLPSTIDAFKSHIFNDAIWPNLSDEDGGVGLVSYMRLAEGGNLAIGEGKSRGYIEVCDGLAVKGWSVSHGKCMHHHGKRGSGSGHTLEQFGDALSRRASQSVMTPTGLQHGREGAYSLGPCVTDSSAFFLRDDHTGSEVLIFGDVEPDTLSLSPRTAQVWADAAPKVASGLLRAVFIECSYDESQSDDTLFGHLAPRHVVAELRALADKVDELSQAPTDSSHLKRKRMSNGLPPTDEPLNQLHKPRPAPQGRRRGRRSSPSPFGIPSEGSGGSSAMTARSLRSSMPEPVQDPSYSHASAPSCTGKLLVGLRVIIIHVKDNLKDDTDAGETILAQLQDLGKAAGLECTFSISVAGSSLWL